jgi:outer membrane protein assembly factor BamB
MVGTALYREEDLVLGSRQRLIIGAMTTLAALVAGAVLIDRFVLQAEWWQVDRSETGATAPPLAPLGPPPGPMVTSWQLATPVYHSGLPPYDQVAHAVIRGQLIVVSGHGLSVRDGRTGQARWHYYRSGWSLLGWAATGDRIVAYSEREGNRGDRLLLGFDVVSGRELWRQSGAVPAATDRTTLRWPGAAGTVLTTDGDRTTLHGRSAQTGRRLWTKTLPDDCVLPEAAAYASDGADGPDPLTAVALDCADHSRVLAVDPATGRVRLDASYDAADPPEVVVRGAAVTAVVVFDGTTLRVYRDGKQLLSRVGDDACATMCPAAAEADRLIMVYRPAAAKRSRVEAVDLRSGRTLWGREAPDYAAVTVSAGRVYALRPNLAENLLPAGIDIIGLAGGDVTTVPTPVVLGSRRDVLRPWLVRRGARGGAPAVRRGAAGGVARRRGRSRTGRARRRGGGRLAGCLRPAAQARSRRLWARHVRLPSPSRVRQRRQRPAFARGELYLRAAGTRSWPRAKRRGAAGDRGMGGGHARGGSGPVGRAARRPGPGQGGARDRRRGLRARTSLGHHRGAGRSLHPRGRRLSVAGDGYSAGSVGRGSPAGTVSVGASRSPPPAGPTAGPSAGPSAPSAGPAPMVDLPAPIAQDSRR